MTPSPWDAVDWLARAGQFPTDQIGVTAHARLKHRPSGPASEATTALRASHLIPRLSLLELSLVTKPRALKASEGQGP